MMQINPYSIDMSVLLASAQPGKLIRLSAPAFGYEIEPRFHPGDFVFAHSIMGIVLKHELGRYAVALADDKHSILSYVYESEIATAIPDETTAEQLRQAYCMWRLGQ